MKKLMIVLAAVALAGATQAATVKWQTGAIKTPASSPANITASNIGLYFYASDIADPWATKATASGEGDAVTYSIAASSGLGSTQFKSGNATITPSSTYSNGDTAYSAVILTYDSNGDGKIGVGDYYMTGTGSYALTSDVSTTKNITMGSWTQITASSSGGTTPVPEPTSGLLLLIGGAMVALRRRRA